MKPNRTTLFIFISSFALLAVLSIQVRWMLQSAKEKEELFHEKANIVLARTTEMLSADKNIAGKLEHGDWRSESPKIDSLLQHYMNYYNFHSDYTFEVVPALPLKSIQAISDPVYSKNTLQACYDKSLDEMKRMNKWELRLHFPNHNGFIKAEMGIPFIGSVVLIVIVLLLFGRTVQSLAAGKKISEYTTDFLNNMTHEFKTPLTNIALAGKLIVKSSALHQEDKIKHYSGIILEENEKLRLQVEQVLSMSALEIGGIPLQKTELDLHLLLDDLQKSVSIQVEHLLGHLKVEPAAQQSIIMGDKIHLGNALRNLVDNAIKYSGGKPDISVRTLNRDQYIAIIVSDKGIGIEKKYRKKVFAKFFRVPKGDIHDVKGFGLGLAYVKTIIELHDGTIALESEKGKGTTFTILLPYV